MNRNSVVATVKAICTADLEHGVTSSGEAISYIEIFEIPTIKRKIGISSNGYWCSCDSTIREINGNGECRVLFQLLEIPIRNLVETIKAGLGRRNLPEKLLLTFPFDEIVVPALDSSWKDLALKWLEDGYPTNDEIDYILSGKDKQNSFWLKKHQERLGEFFGI
ncbi:MAG: hypothetical protein AAF402_06320 [Pseudomonadota bacterium]